MDLKKLIEEVTQKVVNGEESLKESSSAITSGLSSSIMEGLKGLGIEDLKGLAEGKSSALVEKVSSALGQSEGLSGLSADLKGKVTGLIPLIVGGVTDLFKEGKIDISDLLQSLGGEKAGGLLGKLGGLLGKK